MVCALPWSIGRSMVDVLLATAAGRQNGEFESPQNYLAFDENHNLVA